MGAAVIISCKDDDNDKIKQFSAQVEATNSSVYKDKYNTVVVFSTDGGTTWVDYPTLKPGDAYKAKVIYRHGSSYDAQDIDADECYAFDWSQSTPVATGATNTFIADFVMQSNSAIIVTVSDYKPFNPSSWTGKWAGSQNNELYTEITQDGSNPNKFIMDNFVDSLATAYFVMNPSTVWATQTIDMPLQPLATGGTVSGKGSYDQCRGWFVITTEYIAELDTIPGNDTTDFDYLFERP